MQDLSRQAVGGQEGEDEAASVLNAITGQSTMVRDHHQEEALEKKRIKKVQRAREEAEAAKKVGRSCFVVRYLGRGVGGESRGEQGAANLA